MKHYEENRIFLEILNSYVPVRKQLVAILMEILEIEREAVYRRLRGEVAFSFGEIAEISRKLVISLDNIVGMGLETSQIRPCRLIFVDYLNPGPGEFELLESYNINLKRLKEYPESEVCCATNTLPQLFYIKMESLYRFYLFKWKFQKSGLDKKIRFRDIKPSEKLLQINEEFWDAHTEAKTTHLILDKMMYYSIVNDIKYFYSIGMLTEDEVKQLKKELFRINVRLNEIAIKGSLKEGTKHNVYVSNVNLESSHICVSLDKDTKVSMSKWFTLTDTASLDGTTYQAMRIWMQSIIRTSTLISESAERERIKYFNTQDELIDTLGS